MFQKQSHSVSDRERLPATLIGRFGRRLRTVVFSGLSAMLLASCGGDGGGAAAAASDDGNTVTSTIVRIGNGIGDSFELGQIGVVQPMLQSGGSTQLQINFVNESGNAVTDALTVTISSNCIANSQASIEGELETSSGGLTVNYNTNGCTGEDVITASTTTPSGNTIQATGTVTIEEDQVLSVQFIPPEEPIQLALRGVGGIETARVTFRLVGQQSAPIVGETISFSLSTEQGGIALAETSAESDSMGEVTAIVQSGTVHTTVVVTATHDATGVAGNSDGINISTGIAQANRLSMSIEVRNPRGFNFDGTEVGIGIIAADQFGNPVPDNTVISFASPEGGTIPSSCSTVDGRCSVSWISSEPRPLDGRATIIAFTSGAEEFGDSNSNAIFDDGDTFDASMDLDEPFVDENENGMYDAGEFFFDFNSSGAIDLADGVWNGPLCAHSSLCAPNADEIGISQTALIVMATDGIDVDIDTSGANPFPPVGGTINIEAGSTDFISGLTVSDENGNAPAIGTTVNFESTVGALEGTTEFEIGSSTEAAGPWGILLAAPADPATGILIMRAEVPGVVVQERSWVVAVQCSAPSNPMATNETQTSAVLSWTENGNANSWNVEHGPAGFIEGTGTNSTTDNPHLLEDLTAATDYEYYVSSFCGAARSDSAGPFAFSTTP